MILKIYYLLKKPNKFRVFVWVLLFFTQISLATEIKLSLNPNSVSIGESFQIIYTTTQDPDADPNFTPLEQDFSILNQSKANQSSCINGRCSKTIQWTLQVIAKRSGNLTIPVISFGNDLSESRNIQITNSIITVASNKPIFLEVEATPKSPYVQSQVIFTIRLYSRAKISSARLSQLKIADAIIEKLGESKTYSKQINSINYEVIEIKYAIFPQKIGITSIEPVALEVSLSNNIQRHFSGFFNFTNTQYKRLTSNKITLDVQAIPENFSEKEWFPAEQVVITEKWSANPDNMQVGEPITRTLILKAKGVTTHQIPKLHGKINLAKLKNYADNPVLTDQKNPTGITAVRKEKIVYIPTKSGNYLLPSIKIPWFNTTNKTMEFVQLPKIMVTALAEDITEEYPTQAPANNVGFKSVKLTETSNLWMWLAIILAIAWLATLAFLVKKYKSTKVKPADFKKTSLKYLVPALKQDCNNNDKIAVKKHLLVWGKIKFNSNNLAEIATHCDAYLRDEIILLNHSLYAAQGQAWQGKKLFKAFIENQARAKIVKKINDGLEPLYKV